MATCRDVVTRALHMARVVGRSETPTATELRDGMTVLQTLYDGWLTGGMFGRLTDVYETGGYEAQEGERVTATGAVTLPSVIDDERKPRDLAAIEVSDVAGRRAYVWDRTAWTRIDSLEPENDAPLANRGVNGLAACVAVAYADEFGAELRPGVQLQSLIFKAGLSYKIGTERPPATSVYY